MAGAVPTDTVAEQEVHTSGITSDSLTAALKSRLDAQHVEIEDMSGKGP